MKLPSLYKITKTKAIQQYDVQTNGAIITVTQGQVDGKKQDYHTTCKGMNIGKSNETTPEGQAELEAKSKHAKKQKAGYTLDPSGELTVKLPQKVKPYLGNEHKITFPCYSTPKLNGINGIYWLDPDGSLRLTSRGGDLYPPIPHLEDEIRLVMSALNTTCLNGELYIHGQHLQDITSAVKKPKELSTQLAFHIFEAPYTGTKYHMRRTKLLYTLELLSLQHVVHSSGILATSKSDLDSHYDVCMSLGLEGTVIYSSDAPYEFNTRSSHVYKYKKTLDTEVQILSFNFDKNSHPVFNCSYNGKEFKVKPKGTDAERKQIVIDFPTMYLNNYYKIEYETLSKDGIPLKPVGIGLRACDQQGEPLE